MGTSFGFKKWFAGLSRKQKIVQSLCLIFFAAFFLVFAISSIQNSRYSRICKEMGGSYQDATSSTSRKVLHPMGCYLSEENYKNNEEKIEQIKKQYYRSLPPFHFYLTRKS